MSEESTQEAATESPASSHLRDHHFDSERAREAQRKSAEAKRRKRAEREQQVQLAHLTFRQRMGLAMAEVDLVRIRRVRDAALDAAEGGDMRGIHALARLTDQAYGRAEQEAPADGRDADEKAWEEMSPAERAAYRAALMAEVAAARAEANPTGDATDPRDQDVTK